MPVLVRISPTPSQTPIAPFGDAAEILPLLDVPLRLFQEQQAQAAGFTVVDAQADALPDDADALCWADVVFTAETLSALWDASNNGSRLVQAGVKAGTALFDFVQPLTPQSHPDRDLPLPLWAGPLLKLNANAEPEQPNLCPICDEEGAEEVRVDPSGPPPHLLRVPKVTRLGGRFVHWVHVLNLNQAMLVTARHQQGATGRKNHWRGKKKAHPTAFVQGSILGAEVEVSALASVIDSFLGDGVQVADHAILHRCVVGAGCHTLIDTHLRRVVAFGGSTLSNLGTEDLLLGREIFITTGVAFFGGKPGHTIVVDGKDTRRPILGGAVGHGCILGARALFDAGVAVPSGTVIVGRPDDAISRVNAAGVARALSQFADPKSEVA